MKRPDDGGLVKTITEQILVRYDAPTVPNPSGISGVLMTGLVYQPPQAYRTFESQLEPDEIEMVKPFIIGLRDRVTAELQQRFVDDRKPVPPIAVAVTLVACSHRQTGLVTQHSEMMLDPDIELAVAAGLAYVEGYEAMTFQTPPVTAEELQAIKDALAPLERRIADQCQVLRDDPHYVPPVALRGPEATQDNLHSLAQLQPGPMRLPLHVTPQAGDAAGDLGTAPTVCLKCKAAGLAECQCRKAGDQ